MSTLPEETNKTLHVLAEALAATELKYKFTISPHPVKAGTARVVFSRPTFQAPESPTFVTVDVAPAPLPTDPEAAVESDGSGTLRFVGQLEQFRWPLFFTVKSGVMTGFSEAYLDQAWNQKMKARTIAI